MFFLHIYKPPRVNINGLNIAIETMLNQCLQESSCIDSYYRRSKHKLYAKSKSVNTSM